MNIIVTNVGRRGYLIEYLKEVVGEGAKVFASDCDKTASGLYCKSCDGFFLLPRPVDNPDLYVTKLISLCKEKKIEIVIPVIDPEIDILSKNKEQFAKENIQVIVSDKSVLEICYNKISMNSFLDSIGISYPRTYSQVEEFKRARNDGIINYPIIVKPILGSGSVETFVVNNDEQLDALFHDGMIIQQKISGEEFGVDVFNSFEKIPVRCVIKKKISMRSGETDKSVSVKNAEISEMAMKIAKKLQHIGNLDFDVMAEAGKYYVIDLNPRFGGGYPATHAIGVNLVELLYKMCVGEKIAPVFDNYDEGLMVMKTISVVMADSNTVNNIESR